MLVLLVVCLEARPAFRAREIRVVRVLAAEVLLVVLVTREALVTVRAHVGEDSKMAVDVFLESVFCTDGFTANVTSICGSAVWWPIHGETL